MMVWMMVVITKLLFKRLDDDADGVKRRRGRAKKGRKRRGRCLQNLRGPSALKNIYK